MTLVLLVKNIALGIGLIVLAEAIRYQLDLYADIINELTGVLL